MTAERRGWYQLNEHFWSLQGEGEHAGRTAVFLRLQGCSIGCPWCDSKLTWYAGGARRHVDELVALVRDHPPADLLVVTGGEPLIHDLDALLAALHGAFPERETHLETAGVYPFKGARRPHWVTLSPKAAAGWRVADDVLAAASELKYVVDEDFAPRVALAHLARHRELTGRAPPPVRLMPEGAPPRHAMVERTLGLLAAHPTWRFGPRLQYAYPTVAALEGENNRQVSAAEARAHARGRRPPGRAATGTTARD